MNPDAGYQGIQKIHAKSASPQQANPLTRPCDKTKTY